MVGNDHRSSSLESGSSPKQDTVYSVPVPQDARRTPSDGSRASSETGGQPAESEVKQMEEDDDDEDDDGDDSVEYQIPRSTPVHAGIAPHTSPSQQQVSCGAIHTLLSLSCFCMRVCDIYAVSSIIPF